jgi:hypothetical protein
MHPCLQCPLRVVPKAAIYGASRPQLALSKVAVYHCQDHPTPCGHNFRLACTMSYPCHTTLGLKQHVVTHSMPWMGIPIGSAGNAAKRVPPASTTCRIPSCQGLEHHRFGIRRLHSLCSALSALCAGRAHTCFAIKPLRPAALSQRHVAAPLGGAPAPHIAGGGKLAAGVQLLHCTAKVAPRVGVLYSTVKALAMARPARLAPVQPRCALRPEVMHHLLRRGQGMQVSVRQVHSNGMVAMRHLDDRRNLACTQRLHHSKQHLSTTLPCRGPSATMIGHHQLCTPTARARQDHNAAFNPSPSTLPGAANAHQCPPATLRPTPHYTPNPLPHPPGTAG